ncbi:hypothetical protein TRFO_24711 [Tritrichomonas foetus]|uniref:DUF3447 domain-containing protein n=1 Tax=Tritrichomonas foetus TaxID=1144522 RepID=A0A1J4KBJ5_9EUKA|nr:hypothetical protein TRFO_24711 [Tritrichomonas foetus]|eukprot:OHT07060.1 hypothetical protein TRFO_24711 [Tritrichomonas foetus]
MGKLTQKEFRKIDTRVNHFSEIQSSLSWLLVKDIEDCVEDLMDYEDPKEAQFIAHEIIYFSQIRMNLDEKITEVAANLLIDHPQKDIIKKYLLSKPSTILRRLYDKGLFEISDIQNQHPDDIHFSDILHPNDDKSNVMFGDKSEKVTKEFIYNKYPLNTIELAIKNDDVTNATSLLDDVGLDHTVEKSPFIPDDEPKSLLDHAALCSATNWFDLLIQKGCKCNGKTIEYAIMNGKTGIVKKMKEKNKDIHLRYYYGTIAKYFNILLMQKKMSHGFMVKENIMTIQTFYEQLDYPFHDNVVYDLIDDKEMNDVTMWVLCVGGMSQYLGNKYLFYAMECHNDEIQKFIRRQGIKPFI